MTLLTTYFLSLQDAQIQGLGENWKLNDFVSLELLLACPTKSLSDSPLCNLIASEYKFVNRSSNINAIISFLNCSCLGKDAWKRAGCGVW